MKKPNILYLFADQFRADALGCTGGYAGTPNLDRIAAQGVLFDNCVTNCPLCIPARVTLALGRYPHSTGVWTNTHYTMPEASVTWFQAVRQAGYRTSLIGKTHLHPHAGDLREREYLMHAYGFDDVHETAGPHACTRSVSTMTEMWRAKGELETFVRDFEKRASAPTLYAAPSTLPLEDYYDTYVGQRAREYLEKYDDARPWFCHVSFGGPHEPWDAPEPFASMYDPRKMPKPLPKPRTLASGRPSGTGDGLYKNAKFRVPADETQRMRANYAGSVTLIDEQIGQILQVIARRGELENTVIVFTSDHGEMNGDYELFHKRSFLGSSLDIPLIIRTPQTLAAAAAGRPRTSHGLAELMDVGPTIAEIAGAKLAHEQFARSLCPALEDPQANIRGEVLSEYLGEIMLKDNEWKIVLNAKAQPYVLFDLQKDPTESENLAGSPEMAAVEQALKERVLRRLVGTQVIRG